MIACLRARFFKTSIVAVLRAAFCLPRAILNLFLRIAIPRALRCMRFKTSSSSSVFSTKSSMFSNSLSLFSDMFIPFRTSANIAAALVFSLLGNPVANFLTSLLEAKPRILVPDIPLTPSASGSRVPADTTLISLKTYPAEDPLYLSNSFLNSCTLSEPTTTTTFLCLPVNSTITSIMVRALDLITDLPNAFCAYLILSL